MYYLKLHHMVDEKMHARSPALFASGRPAALGGKGTVRQQRFGENGSLVSGLWRGHPLKSQTIKSDDVVVGRVKAL